MGQRQDGKVQKLRGGNMVAKKKTTKKKVVEKKTEEVDVFASPVTGMVYETTILFKNEPVGKDE